MKGLRRGRRRHQGPGRRLSRVSSGIEGFWVGRRARLVVRDRADGCTAGAGVIKGLAEG